MFSRELNVVTKRSALKMKYNVLSSDLKSIYLLETNLSWIQKYLSIIALFYFI